MPDDMRNEHTMTTIEDGGAHDGAQDQRNPADHNPESEPSDAADINGGARNPEAGSGGEEEEGGVPGEGEGAEAEVDENGNPIEAEEGAEGENLSPFDPQAFSEDLIKKVEERIKPPAPPPAELTESQWAEKEAEFGVPRAAIQRFTGMAVRVHDLVMQAMDARFAKLEKADALRTLSRSKGFEDALRYPKGIETYLSKFDPKFHSNPELLKQAVIYARGLASSRNIQRVRVESERHKRITGAARPSSPGSSAGAARRPGGASGTPLNATQKQVMDRFGMSEKEYRNLQKSPRIANA